MSSGSDSPRVASPSSLSSQKRASPQLLLGPIVRDRDRRQVRGRGDPRDVLRARAARLAVVHRERAQQRPLG
jgi:hypothetical protein